MEQIYSKMYASVVGDVDNVLSDIAELVMRENCGKEELIEVGMKLKAALLKAEDMYVESEEE